MIAVIHSKLSNVGSVMSALSRIGAKADVTDVPDNIRNSRALILPGVGAFDEAMSYLKSSGLESEILNFAATGKPILGICLGMQLLAETSSENGFHQGLGLIAGRVERLKKEDTYRVPNIGWCDTELSENSVLFKDLGRNEIFYFVHSYILNCKHRQDIAGSIYRGSKKHTVAVQNRNIFGVQFHPERSQDAGLVMLQNFVNYAHNTI